MMEVALAMLLLVGSGLLLRSFAKMLATDPGFNAEHVLTASIALPEHDYPTQDKSDAFYRELLVRVKKSGRRMCWPLLRIRGILRFTRGSWAWRTW